jgi:hypothetical protein
LASAFPPRWVFCSRTGSSPPNLPLCGSWCRQDKRPGCGTFERFSVESQPVIAPPNARGDVAFFASLLRGAGAEGLFLTGARGIVKVAAEGDQAPGGGSLSGFGRHPIPSVNAEGNVVFAAAVSKGRTVEGIFESSRGTLRAVAVAGQPAPGIPSGTFASLDFRCSTTGVTSPFSPRCDAAVKPSRRFICAVAAGSARSSARKIRLQRAGSSRHSARPP